MTCTRSMLLALSLSLAPTLALAQDAAPAASKPAGKAVAEAILKLRKAKGIARLTQVRHYVMRRRSDVILFTLEGSITQPMDGPPNWRLDLLLKARRFSRPGRIEFSYQVGNDGTLRRIGLEEVRSGKGGPDKKRGVRGTIANGEFSGAPLKNGQPAGPAFTLPWSDNTLPAIFLWFVVPSLFDQGLPTTLNPEVLNEEKLRPNRKFETASFVRTSKAPFKNKAGVLIHMFETTGKHDTTKAAVAADGPQKGLVLQVKVGKSRTFDYITAKEYAQLEKDAPLIANEGKAQQVLRSLRYAQESHKRSESKFAPSLDPLEAKDTYLAKRLKELQPAYLVLMRGAPDGSTWMAIAVPAEPGKTGKRYFVTNQDGKLYASTTKLELDDSCAIPKGAKLVE